jgi:hypothetical protein
MQRGINALFELCVPLPFHPFLSLPLPGPQGTMQHRATQHKHDDAHSTRLALLFPACTCTRLASVTSPHLATTRRCDARPTAKGSFHTFTTWRNPRRRGRRSGLTSDRRQATRFALRVAGLRVARSALFPILSSLVNVLRSAFGAELSVSSNSATGAQVRSSCRAHPTSPHQLDLAPPQPNSFGSEPGGRDRLSR